MKTVADLRRLATARSLFPSTTLERAIDRRLGPDTELGLVAWKEQNLLMAQRPVATFGFVVPWSEQLQRGIAWQREAPQRRWLLVQEPALSQCIDRARAQLAGRSNRRLWWLVPAGAVTLTFSSVGLLATSTSWLSPLA